MTEPPEPRDPEEGGGEDDYYLNSLDDDMLLDALGSGGDASGELGDMLGAWRDDVESEPVGPIAENAQEIHELNQQYDKPAEPPGPRAPESGGSMSLADVIARLQMVAGNTAAAGPLSAANSAVENDVRPQLMQAVEQLTEMFHNAAAAVEGNQNSAAEIQGAGEHAATAIEEAIDMTSAALDAITRAVEHEQVFRNTVTEVAGRMAGG